MSAVTCVSSMPASDMPCAPRMSPGGGRPPVGSGVAVMKRALSWSNCALLSSMPRSCAIAVAAAAEAWSFPFVLNWYAYWLMTLSPIGVVMIFLLGGAASDGARLAGQVAGDLGAAVGRGRDHLADERHAVLDFVDHLL